MVHTAGVPGRPLAARKEKAKLDPIAPNKKMIIPVTAILGSPKTYPRVAIIAIVGSEKTRHVAAFRLASQPLVTGRTYSRGEPSPLSHIEISCTGDPAINRLIDDIISAVMGHFMYENTIINGTTFMQYMTPEKPSKH